MKTKIFIVFILLITSLSAQETKTNFRGSDYEFTIVKYLDNTPVPSQGNTGTCWSFSGVSFLESEAMRIGKVKNLNLSEMYIVRFAYLEKAYRYLLLDGKMNFGQGSWFHDVKRIVKNYGLVPEEAYPGRKYDDKGRNKHNHKELYSILKSMVETLNSRPQGGYITPAWKEAFTGVLNAYLGELPQNTEDFKFSYEGKEFTPKSFANYLGINPEDYVELTSFKHHPFYTQFVLEVPDNWSFESAYNLPIDELMQVMENAIMQGYTFAWGGDVSEPGFNHYAGLAIMPENPKTLFDKRLRRKKSDDVPNAFLVPVKEKEYTQDERQYDFEYKYITDDHAMHAVGIAKDQTGKKYFIIKNSWGQDSNGNDGYLYMSYNYAKARVIAILVHKEAIPKNIRKKLGIK